MNNQVLKEYDKHTLESEEEGTPPKEGKDKGNSLGDLPIREASASPFLHKKWVKILLGALIIIAFLGFVAILIGIKDSKECLANPFIYGVNNIETTETGDLNCNCFFTNPKYVPFSFDNTNITVRKQ